LQEKAPACSSQARVVTTGPWVSCHSRRWPDGKVCDR
jgi:hypothetical protein